VYPGEQWLGSLARYATPLGVLAFDAIVCAGDAGDHACVQRRPAHRLSSTPRIRFGACAFHRIAAKGCVLPDAGAHARLGEFEDHSGDARRRTSATGFFITRQLTESGMNKAGAPAGAAKSTNGMPGGGAM
jgi:hypothetical protein